jgi:hypothetical protein
MKIDATLQEKGIHTKAKNKIYQKMWHPWLPRKVSYVMAYNGRRTPNWGMAHKNKVKAH